MLSGAGPADVNHWQRLKLITALSQNGIPTTATQSYLGPHWRDVRPFALEREDPARPWIDPGPPPFGARATTRLFFAELVAVIERGSHLHPSDGVIQGIFPGGFGSNNTWVGTTGPGVPFNPATDRVRGQSVAPRRFFPRAGRVLGGRAHFRETPPGHWNSIANAVMDHPSFQRRIGGVGDVLAELEYEVKMYFALNAAVHDAACAAWTLGTTTAGARSAPFATWLGWANPVIPPAPPTTRRDCPWSRT